jgi:hypothetical protein
MLLLLWQQQLLPGLMLLLWVIHVKLQRGFCGLCACLQKLLDDLQEL